MPERNPRDVGGTPGGLGAFLVGVLMVAVGGFLLLNQVSVHGGFWNWAGIGGHAAFGVTLIPFLFGIGLLFFDGKSAAGWVLFALGGLAILLGILVNLNIYFRPTSLFNTLIMLGCLVGGIGLVARSVFAFEKHLSASQEAEPDEPYRTRPL